MYEIAAVTHPGRVRDHNEDTYLLAWEKGDRFVSSTQPLYVETVSESFLLAVADGMGGLEAGEVASQLALNECAGIRFPLTEASLRERVGAIPERLRQYAEAMPVADGMGTTLAGLVQQDDQAIVFHLGDSRVYRYRAGYLNQITQDHSLVQSLVDMGQLKLEEMNHHPEKHILLRCLDTKTADAGDQLEVQILRKSVRPGDSFLICTDGLIDLLTHDEMEAVFREHASLTDVLQTLVDKALERGGFDNITVVGMKRRADTEAKGE